MNWAVVIGVDRYWSEASSLRGGVRDALRMREWLLDAAGGNVAADSLILLLSPRPGSEPDLPFVDATKDKIMVAVNDLMTLSGGKGERLYFFYAGHGLTARVANRDESALVATDFNAVNTDHSIALRSLWEFFETTQFDDQFFFVDACRNIPFENREFEIGRWTLPRARDPGVPPVQQFILYATSPGLEAAEVGEAGSERGAFTQVLLDGLRGGGRAKAWSWERDAYEVRWERLVDFVKARMEAEKNKVGDGPAGPLFQIPQDAGGRGVAGRDRDPVLASFPRDRFPAERLEVLLEPDDVYHVADVRVLNAMGDVVDHATQLTGLPVSFELPPKTYALRAQAPDYEEGRTKAPVELYEPPDKPETISLRSVGDAAGGAGDALPGAAPADSDAKPQDGEIVLRAADPLAVVEVRDETGEVRHVASGSVEQALPPGFYRVRLVTPEAAAAERFIALAPGERESHRLSGPKIAEPVRELVEAVGGKVRSDNTVVLAEGLDPIASPRRTTIVALAGAAAIRGEPLAKALGLRLGELLPPDGEAGVVLLLDAGGTAGTKAIADLAVRLWPAGETIPGATDSPRAVEHGIGEFVAPLAEAKPHWLSLEPPGGTPIVFALTPLRSHVSMIVAQLDRGRLRLFEYLPTRAAERSSEPGALRRVEHLERLLLAGRLDAAEPLARELAATAADDPLAGCLGGYTLLRLGHAAELAPVADALVASAPGFSDGYVLRGEHEAAGGRAGAARQAFADAIGTGIPLFGEGLTRLVEGLRATGFSHPRAAIVRHIFQRHVRGSMWSVFSPVRPLQPGRLVITGADTGSEA